MCGIAAVFACADEAPPVSAAELLRMRDRMAARGPDGAGLWVAPDGRVGLAHRRLAILDPSEAGAQPMHDPATGNVIVFNGEIYNYRALRRDLEAAGVRFRSGSDTEVLLALYAACGEAMLPKLRGMFAFALWDARRQGLLLARDPFGIKPLYYADDGRSVRVASQVKALLAGGAVDTTPDPAGHVGFFLWGHVPEPFTLYRGIRALPAGSSLWIGREGRRSARVFFDLAAELRDPRGDAARAPKDRVEAHERLRDALLDSVRHHLVADVPVGVFLSSGRDSTTVAGLAAEAAGGSLQALTLGFREYAGGALDETTLAAEVARLYGLRHEVRWVTREDFASALEPLLQAMDQPSIDGVNTYFVARAAREAGWKVALSGLGGDEFFAGYPSFEEVPRAVRRLRLFRAQPRLGRMMRRGSGPLLRLAGLSPKWAGLFEYGGEWAGAYLLRRALYMPWELDALFDPRFVREGLERLDTLAALGRAIDGIASDRLRLTALEAAWYMRNQLLRDTDWAGMAHGLEVRVPLVDAEVLRVVAGLCKARLAPGKRELASCPRPGLPEAIVNRRKTGFAVPVREWLLADRRLRRGNSREARGLRGWAQVVYAEPSPREGSALQADARSEPVTKSRVGLLAPEMCTPGGVQAYMLRLVEALAEDSDGSGCELYCVSLNDGTASLLRHPALRGCVAVKGASRSRWRLARALLSLPRLDTLVVGHLGPSPLGWLLRASGRVGRYFVILYGIEAWQRAPWTRRFATLGADTVVAIARYTAERFTSTNGVANGTFCIIPPAASERAFAPDRPFRLHGDFKLLCVARLDASERYKGFETIFQALARIGDPPRPHLNLVGTGDDRERLEAVASQLGVGDRVTFWGVLDDAALAAAYEACDVFVMPSMKEGFGIVFLEAMLRGKPCIGGAHGGTPEVIRHGETGYLVSYGDVDALLRHLLALRADPELRRRLGARGREIVTTTFSAAAFRHGWRQLVLGERRPSGCREMEPVSVRLASPVD
ncbi:MAG TPA: asparagine synthase (glutamine-hydrolyzing) [Vicinamibacterales bacterium]|nr:asparagine synthase (glutamine-hydrolyzing) [Vicinamibacterales bacterium]